MANFPRDHTLNDLLNTSLGALKAYNDQIEAQSSGAIKKVNPVTANPVLVANLGDLLADTRSELQKQLKTTSSIVRIDTRTIRALEEAMDKLLHDVTTENKVNAAHFALYGSSIIPFWNELKNLQQLLLTDKRLRRGQKAEAIDEQEEDTEER